MMKYIIIALVMCINLNALNIKLTKAEEHYLKTHTIKIGTEIWKPIVYKENDKLQGIIGDILNKSLSHLLIKPNIKIIQGEWSDIYKSFIDHKIDILPALYYSKKREEYGNYSKKLFTLNEYIYCKENTNIKNFKDLKNKRLAIVKGYVMIEKVHKKYPNIEIVETNNLKQSVDFLLQNKVDAILDGQIIIENFLKNNLIVGLEGIYQNSFAPNDIYLITNIQKPILRSIFSKVIDSLTTNEKNEIFKNYNINKNSFLINYILISKIVFVLLLLFSLFIYRNYLLKKANNKLKRAVNEKTKELQKLNANLELRIRDEIQKASVIEKKLYESEKLASMGEMISNISHQWRQPLSIISTSATGLLLQHEVKKLNDKSLEDNLNKINKTAQYLSKTIDDFKDFINIKNDIEIVQLSEIINKCVSMQSTIFTSKNITVVKIFDDNIIVSTYINILMRAIVNIINNTIDAFEKEEKENKYLFINTYKKESKGIIEIYDNAGGITDDILTKIFEAYFTTKHQSQGTGLSLNITYNIIKNNLKGDIQVENYEYTYRNEKCKGAKFIIKLDIN